MGCRSVKINCMTWVMIVLSDNPNIFIENIIWELVTKQKPGVRLHGRVI